MISSLNTQSSNRNLSSHSSRGNQFFSVFPVVVPRSGAFHVSSNNMRRPIRSGRSRALFGDYPAAEINRRLHIEQKEKELKKLLKDNISELKWNKLPVSDKYFYEDLTCAITLNELKDLSEPVILGKSVFELSALKESIKNGFEHPTTRQDIYLSDIIAIDKDRIVSEDKKIRALEALQRLSFA